jgi:hypothetical protein
MKYEDLINTVSIIVENEKIYKTGLTLIYELNEKAHDAINEEIFKKANPFSTSFKPSDEFEVNLGGILVKFKKNNL